LGSQNVTNERDTWMISARCSVDERVDGPGHGGRWGSEGKKEDVVVAGRAAR